MDEQEEQQPRPGMPYQSPMYNFGSSILIITNPNDVIRQAELSLRGLKETESGELVKIGEPMMNDIGVASIIGKLNTLVNRNTIMSNLDKHLVGRVMEFSGDVIIKDLMVNRIRYQMGGAVERDCIYFQIIIPALMALQRGLDEGDKRFLKGSVQEIYNKVEQQKPKGLLSSLNLFGHKGG